ncbi:dihydrofolate reductase family protein [Ralstonia solanacearum]|uniref:dihydrofolate reductase family protein n=1 Tax=Ralstonia solanacearum TaxID=305 RepID=UPI003CC66CE5
MIGLDGPISARSIANTLQRRGVRHLFVEGGTRVLSMCVSEAVFDRFRLAIAPCFVGRAGASRLQLWRDRMWGPSFACWPSGSGSLGNDHRSMTKWNNGRRPHCRVGLGSRICLSWLDPLDTTGCAEQPGSIKKRICRARMSRFGPGIPSGSPATMP